MKQVLCFGDSNTWGYNPVTHGRYPWGIRWTSILQEKLNTEKVHIIEEGLCGRTTVFDDNLREGRNGRKALPYLLESHAPLDVVVLMLGTNDCKIQYHTDAKRIAKGIEKLIELIQRIQPRAKILLLSPIHLGDQVYKEEFDPEFDKDGIQVSYELKGEYEKLAQKYKLDFLAASDFATFSPADQEHMDEINHAFLAEAIYQKVKVYVGE